jgi:hypothetical protein
MKKDIFLNCTMLTILFLGVIIVIGGTKETFISSGKYPQSVDNPVLQGMYPFKSPGGLSNWNYSSQWKLYPTWAVGSYDQKTNNIKNWAQPCNGTAAPADICGGLYDPIKVEDTCTPPPAKNCRRVNYYCN